MKITRPAAALAVTLAAGSLASVTTAHADPGDTVGAQSHIVCAALYVSPTVNTIEAQVNRLLATYVEADEHKVMYAAMNYVCPEFRPLAVAAFIDLTESQYASPVTSGTTV